MSSEMWKTVMLGDTRPYTLVDMVELYWFVEHGANFISFKNPIEQKPLLFSYLLFYSLIFWSKTLHIFDSCCAIVQPRPHY